MLHAEEAGSGVQYALHVYECGCKDLGEDGQLCMVLLGWAALLSWHRLCRGDGALGSRGAAVYAEAHFKNTEAWQMFVAELSVGSAPVSIWAGVDMDVNGTNQI